MTYVQYPYAVLARLGNDLDSVSTRLIDKKRGAEDCPGLGDGQAKVGSAIDDFRSTWKTSVGDLLDDVGKWGGLSKAVGDMVAQFDAQTAAALNPSGRRSAAP
jgi:hypothetical protein